MARPITAGIAACLVISTVHAAASFQIDHPRIALGEALTLTLSAKPGVLETLDLKPLAADFEIHARNLNRNDRSESLVLTLYPLHPGKIVLPGLGLPGHKPTLQVDSASETVPKVHFSLTTSPATPYVRQPTQLTLEACDDGSLDWKRPVLPTREGLYLRALGEQQMNVERGGERCTAHRWQWSLLATSAGTVDLVPPMLEAGKFGQRLRFPSPALHLDIRSIPGWLPAEVAVGRPRIAAAPLPETWPVNRPLAWRIEITGGYSADAVRQLLALQLAGHPGFLAYPPSVEFLPPEAADAATPRLAVTLYAVPGQSGAFVIPALALPWFDPAGERLGTIALPGRSLEIVNPLHARLWRGGLALLSLSVLAVLTRRAYQALRWRIARRSSLKSIADAQDLPALIRAVRSFTLESGTPPAPTLGTWRTRQGFGLETLPALITSLEAACYGSQTVDLENLKTQALKALEQLRPA